MDITAIPNMIESGIKAVGGIITNAEERGKAIAELTTAKANAAGVVLDYQARLFEAQASIINAEAKSEHGITAMWRPILMLSFGFIVLWNMAIGPMFGMKPLDAQAANLTPELWSLLKLGIGGYVIGRSGEKIVKSASAAFSTGAEDLMKPKQLAKLKAKLARLEAEG